MSSTQTKLVLKNRSKRGHGKSNLQRQHEYRSRARDVLYGPPEDPERRARLEEDEAEWLRYYLEPTFPSPFAPVHLGYISDIRYIVKNGGWKSIVLPRGSGKTTVAQGMVLYFMLTGMIGYAVMIAADGPAAKNLLETFKMWLMWNDRLGADYPEVCAPIRHTRGIPQAMSTLTAHGRQLFLRWTSDMIVLPNAPRVMPDGSLCDAPSANCIIDCDGITGSIRGRKFELPDGRTMRPDTAIVDDPQTPESARSVMQTGYRTNVIKSDVAGLSGPGKDIRIIVPATVIENGDLADEMSDPDKSPDFLGERHPFFLSMPTNMEAWEQYNEVRIDGLSRRDNGKAAKQYYMDHQDELDEGAEVIWPTRCGDNSINGIQWGMDQYFKLGKKAFQSELQGQPISDEALIRITKENVNACETDIRRLIVPESAIITTGFIDCNPRSSGLHWAIVAFSANVTPHIVAYGLYPERGTLVPEGASDPEEDAMLFEGLRVTCEHIRNLRLEIDGTQSLGKIDSLSIDRGYKPDVVHAFCKSARMPFQLFPSAGRAATKYLDAGRDVLKAMPNVHLRKNHRGERFLSHNACVIREIVQRSFLAGPGAPGGIGIHKNEGRQDALVDQILSFKLADKAEGSTGTMYRWTRTPGSEDHWLDCLVGCFAGAFWLGACSATTERPKQHRKRLSVRM